METRPFGRTGIRVPVLGCGAMQVGDARVSESDAASMLNTALDVLPGATTRGLGTIAKRTLAGRPWDSSGKPVDAAHQEYHRRFAALRAAGLDLAAADLDGMALRFSAYAPGVDCVIVGGVDARHLEQNIAAVSAGPLRPEQLAAIRGAFARAATNWRGLI
jgi:aryl-alcohol dehydrogenase-like predicted oxidoreductase